MISIALSFKCFCLNEVALDISWEKNDDSGSLRIKALGNLNISVQEGLAGAERIFLLLDTSLEKSEKHEVSSNIKLNGNIEFKDVNLNVLKTYSKMGYDTGFSDHTLGYEASILATALGAKFIEKHITVNNNLSGPDHKSSLSLKRDVPWP